MIMIIPSSPPFLPFLPLLPSFLPSLLPPQLLDTDEVETACDIIQAISSDNNRHAGRKERSQQRSSFKEFVSTVEVSHAYLVPTTLTSPWLPGRRGRLPINGSSWAQKHYSWTHGQGSGRGSY